MKSTPIPPHVFAIRSKHHLRHGVANTANADAVHFIPGLDGVEGNSRTVEGRDDLGGVKLEN